MLSWSRPRGEGERDATAGLATSCPRKGECPLLVKGARGGRHLSETSSWSIVHPKKPLGGLSWWGVKRGAALMLSKSSSSRRAEVAHALQRWLTLSLGCRQVAGAFSEPGSHLYPGGRLCFQADDLDGEIDLRSCTDVTEFAVQRNYGFQIHVSALQARGVCWLGTAAPLPSMPLMRRFGPCKPRARVPG